MTYTQLLNNFPPRLITTDEQYWATQLIIEDLVGREELSPDEQEYLNLLSLLMEQYDEAQNTVPELQGLVLVQMLVQDGGLKQRDLLPVFKHESIVSDVLRGQRRLTVEHIDKLATFFNLPHRLFFEVGEKGLAN